MQKSFAMKRVLLSFVCLLFATIGFAQSTLKIVDVEMYSGGFLTTGTCVVYSSLVTDIVTGEKRGHVTIKTNSGDFSNQNTIPRDELEKVISALEYYKVNLAKSKPESDTKVVYYSSTDCQVGIIYDNDIAKKTWVPFIKAHSIDKQSFIILKDLEPLLKAFQDSIETIDTFVKGN